MRALSMNDIDKIVKRVKSGERPSFKDVYMTDFCANTIKLIIDFTIDEDRNWFYESVMGRLVIEGGDWGELSHEVQEKYEYIARRVIGDEALWCSREWAAWGHGTMSSSDFNNLVEDEEYILEQAEYLYGALNGGKKETKVVKLEPKERITQMEALLGMVNEGKDVRMYNDVIELKKAKKGGHLTMGIDRKAFRDMCESVMLNNKGKKRKHFAITFVVNEDELLETIKKG